MREESRITERVEGERGCKQQEARKDCMGAEQVLPREGQRAVEQTRTRMPVGGRQGSQQAEPEAVRAKARANPLHAATARVAQRGRASWMGRLLALRLLLLLSWQRGRRAWQGSCLAVQWGAERSRGTQRGSTQRAVD